MKAKRLLLTFRILFYVGVLYFVIRHLFPLVGRIHWRLLSVPLTTVLAAFILFMASHFCYALGWAQILRHFRVIFPPFRLYGYVLESILAKYLPTGLGNVIAKTHLMTREFSQLPPLAVSASVVLVHAFFALVSGLLTLPDARISQALLAVIWITAACLLCTTLPSRLVQATIRKVWPEYQQTTAPFSYGRLLIYALLFFGLQSSFYYVFIPAGSRVPIGTILFIYATAWLGTLLSPVPAGLGVRDGLIYLFLQKHLPAADALNLTLSLRVWHTLFDVVAYLIGLSWRIILKRSRSLSITASSSCAPVGATRDARE